MKSKKNKIVPFKIQPRKEQGEKSTSSKPGKAAPSPHWTGTGLTVLCVLVLSCILIPSIQLPGEVPQEGDIAEDRIKSPGALLVEDKKTTLENRKDAEEGVLDVYDYDPTVLTQISDQITGAFAFLEHVYRQNVPEAYQAVLDEMERDPLGAVAGSESNRDSRQKLFRKYMRQIEELESSKFFQDRVDEFQKMLGLKLSQAQLKTLQWHHYRASIGEALVTALGQVMSKGVMAKKKFIDPEKSEGIRIVDVKSGLQREVTNLDEVYDLTEAENALPSALRDLLPPSHSSLYRVMLYISSKRIQPNLTPDKNQTEINREKTVEAVKPVYFQIKKGEIIVREGDRISAEQAMKLKAIWSGQSDLNPGLGVTGGILLSAILVFLFWVYLKNHRPDLLEDRNKVILLAVLFIGNAAIIRLGSFAATVFSEHTPTIDQATYLFSVPTATGPMLVALLFCANLTIAFTLFTVITVGILLGFGTAYSILALTAGLIAAYQVNKYRKRSAIVRTGLYIGVSNAILILTLNLMNNRIGSDQSAYEMGFGLLSGALAGVLVSGILPVIESLFRVTSDIRLLELSDLSHPLLNDLVVRAPGTYHHSIMVGNLSEAAAEAIGANTLLCRIGGYFHDIGKAGKAEYFIENQKASENKHDRLSPSMSALILISHVKEGEELARRYKLVEPIIDIIREHHGTQLITYFYTKAKELEDPKIHTVNPDDFRYPGPLPRTREAAIVSLADAVEAACRALDDPTPVHIETVVHKIFDRKFIDGQLNESNLTLVELSKITQTFVRYLSGIHHQRIPYPEPPAEALKGAQGVFRDRSAIEPPKGDSPSDEKHKKGDEPPSQSVRLPRA